MPEVHFVGGPDDGKVVKTALVGEVNIPNGYSLNTWMGDPSNGMPWERADLATFVHRDLLAQGNDAVFEADDKHWTRYVANERDSNI